MNHKEYIKRRDEILELPVEVQTSYDKNGESHKLFYSGNNVKQAIDQLVLDVIGDYEVWESRRNNWKVKKHSNRLKGRNSLRANQRQIVSGKDGK